MLAPVACAMLTLSCWQGRLVPARWRSHKPAGSRGVLLAVLPCCWSADWPLGMQPGSREAALPVAAAGWLALAAAGGSVNSGDLSSPSLSGLPSGGSASGLRGREGGEAVNVVSPQGREGRERSAASRAAGVAVN